MKQHWDVLVAGAGPVGTLLAGAVAQQGASVLLLERDSYISDQTRASTLNARSMEIMSSLGVSDLADRPRLMTGHYGGIPVSLEEVESPWAGLWRIAQPELVRLLRAWAISAGVALRTGAAFTRARELPSAIVSHDAMGSSYESMFLVGADGVNSTVRTQLGFKEERVAIASRHMVRCDVKRISIPPRRFEWHGDMVVTSNMITPQLTRLMIFSPRYNATDTPTFTDVSRDWLNATGERVDGGECVWIDHFSNGCSTIAEWNLNHTFLAGDAAHHQPPVGGNSLNAGIQDAHNLAWKITALLNGAPDELAATYGVERAEATAAMQESVREQEILIFGADRQRKSAARDHLSQSASFRRRIARSISGLDTHYMNSTHTGPRASIHHLTRALKRTPLPSEKAALGQKAVVVTRSHAKNVVLVVRPDGHVAWAPGHPDIEPVDAVERWFGDFLIPTVMNARTDG